MTRLVVSAGVLLTLVVSGPPGSEVALEKLGSVKLAILPFDGSLGPIDGAAFAAGLSNALTRVPALNVRSLAATGSPASTEDSSWARTADELDTSIIVRGRVVASSESAVVSTMTQVDLTIVRIDDGDHSVREQHLSVRGVDARDVVLRVIDRIVSALPRPATKEELQAARSEIPGDAESVAAYLDLLASTAASLREWERQRERAAQLVNRTEHFPGAHALLGEAHLGIASLSGDGAGLHYAAAERALRKALTLDGTRPQTARALASLYAKIGRTEESVEVLRPTLAEHPNIADLHAALGYASRYAGFMDRSIAAYRRAQALDGRKSSLAASEEQIAKSLVYKGAYDAALAAQTLAIDHLRAAGHAPDEKMYFYQGMIELYRGNRRPAVELFEQSRATARSLWSDFALAYRAATVGDRTELVARARDLETRKLVDGERRVRLAHLFALADEREASLEHLEAAVTQGFFNYPYLANDPLLISLQHHPRRASVLDRAKQRHTAFQAFVAPRSARPALEKVR